MEQARKRLLLVAGSPTENSVAAFLRNAGHSVTIAAGVSDSLEVLRRSTTELVLIDLCTLRDQDIDSVVTCCKQLGGIPLLVLTDQVSMTRAVKALEGGAENIIPNPIDRKALQLLIANSLRKKELSDECRMLRSRLDKEPVLEPDQIGTARGQTDPLPNKIVPLKKALERPERKIILHALKIFDYNRLETAKALRINRTTLYNKMKKLGLLNRKRSRKNSRPAPRNLLEE